MGLNTKWECTLRLVDGSLFQLKTNALHSNECMKGMFVKTTSPKLCTILDKKKSKWHKIWMGHDFLCCVNNHTWCLTWCAWCWIKPTITRKVVSGNLTWRIMRKYYQKRIPKGGYNVGAKDIKGQL